MKIIITKTYKEEYQIKVHNNLIKIIVLGRIFDDIKNIIEKILLFIDNGIKFQEIDGDCILIFNYRGLDYIYISNTSNVILNYKNINNMLLVTDDYYNLYLKKEIIEIDKQAILGIIQRNYFFPFNNIKLIDYGTLVSIDNNKLKILYQNCIEKDIKYNLYTFNDYVKEAKKLVIKSVEKRTKGINSKICVSMSGGIDSIVIAYCLYLLKKDFICIHWTSNKYYQVDESNFAVEFCKRYNIQLIFIDMSDKINNIDEYLLLNENIIYPFIHTSIYWWDKTYQFMKEKNIKYILSGLNGDGIFGGYLQRFNDDKIFINVSSFFKKSYLNHLNGIVEFIDVPYVINEQIEGKKTFIKCENVKSNNQRLYAVLLQREAMRLYLANKYNVIDINPYIDKDLISFSNSIPKIYKALPYGGKIIAKPILKFAFKENIPFSIISRNSKSCYGVLSEKLLFNSIDKIIYKINQIKKSNFSCFFDFKVIDKILNNKNEIIKYKFLIIDTILVFNWLKKMEENYEIKYI